MSKSYCQNCPAMFAKSAIFMSPCPVCKGTNVRDIQPVVFSVNRSIDLDWLYGEERNGVNLSYEEEYEEHQANCDQPDCVDRDHEFWSDREYWCEEEVYLLGAWTKNDEGKYVPDETGEYAAVKSYLGGAPIVTTEWSKHVKGFARECSPCCPNQIDGDGGDGDLFGYNLPADAFDTNSY